MPLPLVAAAPLLSGLAIGGGAGFFAGSWWSGGWFKWLIILLIVLAVYAMAKNAGVIE